jgi:hypothetical protein
LRVLGARHFAKIAKHPKAERSRALLHRNSLCTAPLARIDESALSFGARHFQLGSDRAEPSAKLVSPLGGGLSFHARHGSPPRTTTARPRVDDLLDDLFDRVLDRLLFASLFTSFVEALVER